MWKKFEKNKIKLALINNKTITKQDFIIKEYQREYVWGIRDIENLLKSYKNNLYIGAGTFVKTNKNQIEIIDGQQRLISTALLFGHLNKKSKISFVFFTPNFTSYMNKIFKTEKEEDLSEIESSVKKQKESSYLLRIIDLKRRVLKFKDLETALKNFSFILIPVDKNLIEDTFLALNTFGTKVDICNLYKAFLIKRILNLFQNNKISAEDKEIRISNTKDQWINIINTINKIAFQKITKVNIEDIFIQGYNSSWIQTDSEEFTNKTSLRRNIKDAKYNPKTLECIVDMFEWSEHAMISKMKYRISSQLRISSIDTFAYTSLKNKPTTILGSLLSRIWSINKDNPKIISNELRFEFQFYCGLIANYISFLDLRNVGFNSLQLIIPTIVKKINASKSHKESKSILEYFKTKIINSIFNFERKFTDFVFNADNIVFTYSNKKSQVKMANSYATKFLLLLINGLHRIQQIDINDNLNDFKRDIYKIYKTHKSKITDPTWTVEHVKNSDETSLSTMIIIPKTFNNITLNNLPYSEKIKLMKKEFFKPDTSDLKSDYNHIKYSWIFNELNKKNIQNNQ